MKNSRGQQLLDTFRVLHGVPFMHTICFFKAWEVRSPTLQTGCKSKLKRRSYGLLKTTASSCAKFRSCEMKSTCEIPQGVSQLRNHLQAHVCHFASWNSIVATNHVAKSPPSYESSCKSSPSCEIISKLWNHLQVAKSQIQLEKSKFKLAKWTIQRAKSTCAISDICYRLS